MSEHSPEHYNDEDDRQGSSPLPIRGLADMPHYDYTAANPRIRTPSGELTPTIFIDDSAVEQDIPPDEQDQNRASFVRISVTTIRAIGITALTAGKERTSRAARSLAQDIAYNINTDGQAIRDWRAHRAAERRARKQKKDGPSPVEIARRTFVANPNTNTAATILQASEPTARTAAVKTLRDQGGTEEEIWNIMYGNVQPATGNTTPQQPTFYSQTTLTHTISAPTRVQPVLPFIPEMEPLPPRTHATTAETHATTEPTRIVDDWSEDYPV